MSVNSGKDGTFLVWKRPFQSLGPEIKLSWSGQIQNRLHVTLFPRLCRLSRKPPTMELGLLRSCPSGRRHFHSSALPTDQCAKRTLRKCIASIQTPPQVATNLSEFMLQWCWNYLGCRHHSWIRRLKTCTLLFARISSRKNLFRCDLPCIRRRILWGMWVTFSQMVRF